MHCWWQFAHKLKCSPLTIQYVASACDEIGVEPEAVKSFALLDNSCNGASACEDMLYQLEGTDISEIVVAMDTCNGEDACVECLTGVMVGDIPGVDNLPTTVQRLTITDANQCPDGDTNPFDIEVVEGTPTPSPTTAAQCPTPQDGDDDDGDGGGLPSRKQPKAKGAKRIGGNGRGGAARENNASRNPGSTTARTDYRRRK
ncbi:MAG: hypothetical protein SGARI_000123 [Bacillariaceae sp.]